MRVGLTLLISGLMMLLCVADASARRTYFTPEQKAKLQSIRSVYVKVLALTERGRGDAAPITDVVVRRLSEIGYDVTTDRGQPHDVEFRVKCEERKKWTGTTRSGGDADHADDPARLWKGPACLFMYLLDGRDLGWHKEVRTEFEDATSAARAAKVKKTGDFALNALKERLETYYFPILITAEWGQDERLLKILNDADTSKREKLKILSAMTNLQSLEALPHLKDIVQDKELVLDGIAALTSSGSDAIPLLTDIFNDTSNNSTVRAAAAKALGKVGAATGDPSVTPPILAYLVNNLEKMDTSADIDFPILTEVVWSLGRLRNEKSIPPVTKLEERVWLIYDNSKDMEGLRDAVNWTIKQIDMDGQIQ